MNYGTCKGCTFEKTDCAERRKIGAKVRGLGITTMRWKCAWRRPAFSVGQPVVVPILERSEYPGEDYIHQFDGYVIGMKGRRVQAYIPKDNRFVETPGDFEFKSGGFVGLSMDHVEVRDGVAEPVCNECHKTHRLDGHEDYCRHATAEQRKRHFGGDWI